MVIAFNSKKKKSSRNNCLVVVSRGCFIPATLIVSAIVGYVTTSFMMSSSAITNPFEGKDEGWRRGAAGVHKCLNDDFVPTQRVGVWTMLNDNKKYIQGALKSAKAIRAQTTTPVDLVVLEVQHKPLTDEEWVDLRAAGWKRCTVEPIPAPQKTRWDLKEKFAVLHVWAMTVYETLVFVDADTFPQNSIDGLIQMDLQWKAVGVTKDIRDGKWVETFNSGVLLLHPSISEYERLLQLLRSGLVYEYTMSDQGFLNEVYKDSWHEIGFVYNANLALYRHQRKFWNSHKLEDINIIHYTMSKPWSCNLSGPYGPICQIWHNATL